MKQKQDIKVSIKKVTKKKKTYYDIILEIEGMSFQVAPKFLNFKQLALLKHKIARFNGDEKK